MSFRGLTMRQAWRFGGGPLKFGIALVLKAIAFKGPRQRLPTYSVELKCDEKDISSIDNHTFLAEVSKAIDLGYAEGYFYRATEVLDPNVIDGYSYLALHRDRKRSIFIGAIRRRTAILGCTVTVTGSLRTVESDDIEFAGHRFYLDAPPPSKRIRVSSDDLTAVDSAMEDYMRRHQAIPFADFGELKRHAEIVSDRAFDARVDRGLFVYENESVIRRG